MRFTAARSNRLKKCSSESDELAGDEANRVALVEITGGEPLLQPETPALGGEATGRWLYRDDRNERRAICGRASARSNQDRGRESARIQARPILLTWPISKRWSDEDEIKFVISTRRDYEFAREFTEQHHLTQTRAPGSFFACVSGPCREMGRAERAGARGMDSGGRLARAAGSAIAQIHLGPGDEGRLTSYLTVSGDQN